MINEKNSIEKSNDQVVIITGGGSGIGRSTAILLAKRKYKIVIVGRRLANLMEVSGEAEKEGAKILTIQEDINNPDAAENIISKTIDRFCRIDILINNAGVPGEGLLLHNVEDNLWFEIINTNLTGVFKLIRAVLPTFISQRSGNIINIASVAASIAMSQMGAYAASKAGLVALSRSIAHDYSSFGIRCNSICPGTILTDMTRSVLRKANSGVDSCQSVSNMNIGSPLEVAKVIAFLCSSDSSFINGSSLVIDGGKFKI